MREGAKERRSEGAKEGRSEGGREGEQKRYLMCTYDTDRYLVPVVRKQWIKFVIFCKINEEASSVTSLLPEFS